MHSDERLVFLVQHWPVNIVAVRVRPVEHYAGYTSFSTGLHNIVQRGDICIEATSHILQVEDDSVDVFHLLRRGLLVLAVERDYRQAGLCVVLVSDTCTGFGFAAETVFRTEYLDNIDATRKQRIDQMHFAYQRRLVANDGISRTIIFGIFLRKQFLGTNTQRQRFRDRVRFVRHRRLRLARNSHHQYPKRQKNRFHFFPVCPNPPVPRSVSVSSVTSTISACSWRAMTIWAMRSPSLMTNSSPDRFMSITQTSPR